MKTGSGRSLKNLAIIFIVVFAILSFRYSVFEPYRIPTGSMIPNLMIGDYIFVNKFSYGFKIPFTSFFPFGRIMPKRGDIAVFKSPRDGRVNYVKRIVGIPGDKISIVNNRIIRNGIEIGRELNNANSNERGFTYFNEGDYDASYVVRYDPDIPFNADTKEITLNKDSFFMMGDNRDYSFDSRFWGVVRRDNILGKVQFVWFSLKYSDNTKEYSVVTDRIFKSVE